MAALRAPQTWFMKTASTWRFVVLITYLVTAVRATPIISRVTVVMGFIFGL